jgi:hypothetical protein
MAHVRVQAMNVRPIAARALICQGGRAAHGDTIDVECMREASLYGRVAVYVVYMSCLILLDARTTFRRVLLMGRLRKYKGQLADERIGMRWPNIHGYT